MMARDLHKLVVQACLGGDHLLEDKSRFCESLEKEWDAMPENSPPKDAIQRIHPSGTVARLHLASCKAVGLSQRDVSRLLLEQPLKEGRMEALQWAWAMVVQGARFGEIPFVHDELVRILPDEAVTHHSAQYGPASYRILNNLRHGTTKELLCRLGILC
jgi:hypothetical protein